MLKYLKEILGVIFYFKISLNEDSICNSLLSDAFHYFIMLSKRLTYFQNEFT